MEPPSAIVDPPKFINISSEGMEKNENLVVKESRESYMIDNDKDIDFNSNVDSKSKREVIDILKKLKLNPLAEEFFPSSYCHDQMRIVNFVPADEHIENDGFPNARRRTNNYSQIRRRSGGQSFRARRGDSIKRTVYVSDIDHNVTEEQLAALFSSFGQVLDCRVCGDPHSRLCFAFVEFSNEYSARASLNLCGTHLGLSPLTVMPSKTAILPVNPTLLPRSETERDMCARTVYCTNIDKKVSQVDIKIFFETRCGEISCLRLLGDHMHSTCIAFVEFSKADSAILALDCGGEILGSRRIRVSLSKTPVRPRMPHPSSEI